MGRLGTGRMENAEDRETLADLLVSGETREEIARAMGCHKDTVTEWKKHEKVGTLVQRKLRDRANEILRRVDSSIERLIRDSEDLSLEELLRIRREFVPHEIKLSGKIDSTPALEELLQEFIEDPEGAVRKLQRQASAAAEDD